MEMAERKLYLTAEELIEKYNLSEVDKEVLLPFMVEVENNVRRYFVKPQ